MRTLLMLVCLAALLPSPAITAPIQLHPYNPHYFLFQERPTILLTSGEHYGAVLNLDFDYVKYLDALKAHGCNYTRIFSGAYREIPGSFSIERNDLAPAQGRLSCPWARSNKDGYALGGKKFDLARWNPEYFTRLKDFVAQAGQRGIVVELSLFCPFYPQKQGDIDVLWKASPMHVNNNINGIGTCEREKVYTLENGNLIHIQDDMVRKTVEELNGFDNVFYEICNEPYFGGVTLEWQAHIAQTITDAEKSLPRRHLIAQNIANSFKKIENANPLVSIFNFHYASPRTVTENYALNRVLGDDETGFRGSSAEPYRGEAWHFLLAGGGLYDNLDYAYTVKSPEGRDTTNRAPGSNTVEIRDQLAILRNFMNGLDFIHMHPVPAASIKTPGTIQANALELEGKHVAAYFSIKTGKSGKPITPDSVSAEEKATAANGKTNQTVSLDLPAGNWKAEWISPLTGKAIKEETVAVNGGKCALSLPLFKRDIALKLKLD